MRRRTVPSPITAEEYAAFPDGDDRQELRAGLLLSEPRPFPRHARVLARLTRLLEEFVDRNALGVVLTDAGFLLSRHPDTVRGPDLAFVRRARYTHESEGKGFFHGAPDLAIEILSPSNRPAEMLAKVADYLAAGSTLVWVIDPESGGAQVYRAILPPGHVDRNGALDGEDVLPGFSATLASILDLPAGFDGSD